MTDPTRKQFEEWCRKQGISTSIWGGMYKDGRAFTAWHVWESRQAEIDKLVTAAKAVLAPIDRGRRAQHAIYFEAYRPEVDALRAAITQLEGPR